MEYLLNPNFAYLLLSFGLVLAVLALLSPGTGILELSAVFALLFAGWAVYNQAVNWWSLAILSVGVVLFIAALRWPKRWAFLLVAILALVLGSAFLFRGQEWWVPAVNPLLAGLVSVCSGVFFWFAARKIIEASQAQPVHTLQALIGKIGEAKTPIHDEGSVQIDGELWSARSAQPISRKARVRVVGREGFILLVEALDHEKE
jgi:membrane-bound serine protease (ClpP class)